jgi:hypothetical protein
MKSLGRRALFALPLAVPAIVMAPEPVMRASDPATVEALQTISRQLARAPENGVSIARAIERLVAEVERLTAASTTGPFIGLDPPKA